MSGYDSDDDDDVVLVYVMDSIVRKIRRRLRIPKHVSAFNGHERMAELITSHEGHLLEQIRMNIDCFHRLCTLLTVQNGIQETHTLTVQEQLMLFLTIVAHGDSNRRSAFEWKHSGETISKSFDVIYSHLVELSSRFIVPPDFNNVSPVITNNRRFFPYFQGCVGAIDGTHVPCVVLAEVAAAYCNRKGFTSQNVMAMVDLEMKFTYIVAGWEGSIHDARVLNIATNTPTFRFPHAPLGKYYLVDAGYKNKAEFLAPFHGQNYHLHYHRRENGDHRKEMFNYRHASLRNVIERTFCVWKNRFRILRGILKYLLEKQRYIVIACAVLHNFIKLFSDEAVVFNLEDDGNGEDDVGEASTQQQHETSNYMGQF